MTLDTRYMQEERTYPGLYMAEDADVRTVVPALCAEGCYVIMLRGRSPENETLLGRRYYDYSDAALTCCAPGISHSAIYTKTSLYCRWIVAFRPELFEKAPSEKIIDDYTFFTYYPKESLHLSVAETEVMTSCINDICTELQHPLDHYSSAILAKHLHRILDYATRFYERQFFTRDLIVGNIIAAYDKLLGQYMDSGKLHTGGLPTAKYCADKLRLSEACFCDVLLHKTGRTHDGYCLTQRIEFAKRKLTGSNISLQQLVADLGFPSVQYFSYLFKKLTGCAPNHYRFLN